MAKIKKPAKKMQMGGKATADSTIYFKKKATNWLNNPNRKVGEGEKVADDIIRQYKKGKPGYDANGNPLKKQKMGGVTKKAKSGGSFPDLNKDGKITKADILKGRGVIAKKGAKVAKKKAGTHKMPDGSIMKNSMMKSGGKMKKCAYGCK